MAIDKEKLYESLIDDAVYADDDKEREYIKNLARSLDALPGNELNQWLIANGDGIFKSLPSDNPLYQMAASVKDPKSWRTNEPDFETMFNNEDVVSEYANGEIPEQRINGVATSNGYLPEQVKKSLEEQVTKQNRIDQMKGTNTIQQIFTPRLYEKRLRDGVDVPLIGEGSLDTWKSLGLDLLENGLYLFNPLGRAAGAATKGLKAASGPIRQMLGKAIDYGANIAANPFAMEVADDIVYDDPNNDRSDFRLSDAAIGTGVNAGIPLLVKGATSGISRTLAGIGQRDPYWLKSIYNFGKGDMNSVLSEIKSNNAKYEKLKAILDTEGSGALDKSELDFLESWGKNYDPRKNQLIEDIMTHDGKTIAEKRNNFANDPEMRNKWKSKDDVELENWMEANGHPEYKNMSETQQFELIPKVYEELDLPLDVSNKDFAKSIKRGLSEEAAKQINNSNYVALNDKTLKPVKKMLGEQFASDYVLNKVGDMSDPESVLNSTIIGKGAKAIKELEDKNKEKEAKSKAMKKHRIGTMITLPKVDDVTLRTWKNGFKPNDGDALKIYNEYKKRGLI